MHHFYYIRYVSVYILPRNFYHIFKSINANNMNLFFLHTVSHHSESKVYNQVVIRSPDSEIFYKLLHNAHQLGIKNGLRL